MGEVTYLNIPAGLLGRWRAEWDSDDGHSEYRISSKGGRLSVAGIDHADGEAFEISSLTYDRAHVAFDTLMPSTGRQGHFVFTLMADGIVEMRFTFTDTCIAVRTGQFPRT